MAGPPEMIKCGWKDCENWFSTGVDMNQHVLINHIKFMKVQFVERDSATVVPKNDAPGQRMQKQSEPRHIPPQPPHPPVFHQPSQPTTPAKPPITGQQNFNNSMTPSGHFRSTSSHRFNPNMATPNPALRHYEYYDDDILIEDVKPSSSTLNSEINQVPDEPSIQRNSETRGSQEDEIDEIELDSSEGTPERMVEAPSKAKKAKNGLVEKTPWALAKNVTEPPPDTMIRLTSSFETVGQMAKSITDELVTRKTLRKKNRKIIVNGISYCIVCLDYVKDNLKCDFLHNNQQQHFITFWKTLYGEEEIRKQNLLQQLTEMQQIDDLLPKLTTKYINPIQDFSRFN